MFGAPWCSSAPCTVTWQLFGAKGCFPLSNGSNLQLIRQISPTTALSQLREQAVLGCCRGDAEYFVKTLGLEDRWWVTLRDGSWKGNCFQLKLSDWAVNQRRLWLGRLVGLLCAHFLPFLPLGRSFALSHVLRSCKIGSNKINFYFLV